MTRASRAMKRGEEEAHGGQAIYGLGVCAEHGHWSSDPIEFVSHTRALAATESGFGAAVAGGASKWASDAGPRRWHGPAAMLLGQERNDYGKYIRRKLWKNDKCPIIISAHAFLSPKATVQQNSNKPTLIFNPRYPQPHREAYS